jgi:SAM-dependent methyltransferase
LANYTKPEGVPTATPTSARGYGWLLGGKDVYEIDRSFILGVLKKFPENLDIARENRQFLRRAVTYLVRDAGLGQFLDMGCGLPTNHNVHQIAQQEDPSAAVVYVDIDPMVLVHGRALLADNPRTTVITADMREPSVGHHLVDDDNPRQIIDTFISRAPAGSYIAFSQVVCTDPKRGALMNQTIQAAGIPWQTRTPAQVDELLSGLEPIDPGLVDLRQWRPNDIEPPLAPVPTELLQFQGAAGQDREVYEYGGVLRVS